MNPFWIANIVTVLDETHSLFVNPVTQVILMIIIMTIVITAAAATNDCDYNNEKNNNNNKKLLYILNHILFFTLVSHTNCSTHMHFSPLAGNHKTEL